MQNSALFASLRILSYVVLGAMAAALLYAVWISLTHWTGIRV